jgi:hypothetical protein
MPTFVGMTRRHGPRVDLNADWYNYRAMAWFVRATYSSTVPR